MRKIILNKKGDDFIETKEYPIYSSNLYIKLTINQNELIFYYQDLYNKYNKRFSFNDLYLLYFLYDYYVNNLSIKDGYVEFTPKLIKKTYPIVDVVISRKGYNYSQRLKQFGLIESPEYDGINFIKGKGYFRFTEYGKKMIEDILGLSLK